MDKLTKMYCALSLLLLPAVAVAQVRSPTAPGPVAADHGFNWWLVIIALAVIAVIYTLVKRTNRTRRGV